MGLFFFLMGLCLLGAVLCEDKTTTVGGITVKVLGQSGKIKVYNGTEDNGIVLTFDGIYEKTSDGVKITGQTRHSFNNFAQLDFSFSDLEASTYPGTDLNVTQFNFSASIDVDPSNAKLVTYVYQFTEEGNITVDGNNVTVYPGDMKFNVKIDSWPFCGRNNVECSTGQNKDVGAFLDFDITVSGSVAPDNTTGQIAGSKVITPKEVTYNGSTTKDMPSGYPSTTVIDKKTTYTFRFEPFDSVLYDPIVSLDGANTEGGVTEEIKTVSYADVTAKLLGSSGKIEITSADNKVVVELDNLKEKDADDKDTTTSYQTFAGKAFTLNGPMDGTYPNTSISVQKITGERTMSNNAMVKLNLYVFKAGGNISNGNEYTIVRAGNVKFNLEISGWNFCNTTSQCNPGNFVGMYLDIDIVIKGKKNQATKKASAGNKGETFDLGDSTVILSKKVYVDDAPVPDDMVNGYPMHVTQGSKEIFRFRFPKFTNKVMYDPTFELGGSTGGAGSLSVTMTTLLIVATTILKMFF